MSFVRAATLLALTAAAANAQTISLHPGETVTLRFEDGNPKFEPSAPAEPMTKYEVYALWRAETQEVPAGVKIVPPVPIMNGEGPPDPPRPTPSCVRLTMRRVPGLKPGTPENTVLFIANGYGSTFAYRAVMHVNGNSAPTDVCGVLPGVPGLEHWAYTIDQLDLSDLHLEPSSGGVTCQ
jgi:hypothetical protein